MAIIHLLGWACAWAYEVLRLHTTLVLVFVSVVLAARYMLHPRGSPLPPGPWGLPLLGYLPFLSGGTKNSLLALAHRFGPIYRLRFGTKSFVVLADSEVIREAFRKEELNVRPNGALYDIFNGYGLLNTSGSLWKEQRRFLHEKLRGLGMKSVGVGREQMEVRIMGEVRCLLHCLASMKGKAMGVGELLCNASTNVICSILMSVRFQPNNPHFRRFMELYDEGFKLFLKCDIASYIPVCRYIPSVSANFDKLNAGHQESSEMIRAIIRKRRESFDPSNAAADILDCYLLEEHRARQEGRVLYDGRDFENQLVQVMLDMFSAGEETVKTCLLWTLVFLLRHPDVMTKVQEELDAVVGRSRMPSLDDQPHLPYTQATLCEVLRRATVVPLGAFHGTGKTTTLRGYTIPEGTTIIPFLYACHMNPKHWDNPEAFDPTRFIDAEGGVKKPRQFIPFGVGGRMCLGQVLARSEIFLFFTSLLHVFDVALPDGEPTPSLEGELTSTYTPKPFKVSFVPREASGLGNFNRPYEFRAAGL